MISCEKKNPEIYWWDRKNIEAQNRWPQRLHFKPDRATGAHFNLPGHSLANIDFTVVEQVKYNNEAYLEEREIYHNQFNTL